MYYLVYIFTVPWQFFKNINFFIIWNDVKMFNSSIIFIIIKILNTEHSKETNGFTMMCLIFVCDIGCV